MTRKLRNKEYRDGYVSAQIKVGLPFQIRALRRERDLSQGDLASLAGMKQPRIAEMEKPAARSLNIETLLRVASALDVAVQIRFVPFSELVGWAEGFQPDTFRVPSFGDELVQLEQTVQPDRQSHTGTERQIAQCGVGAIVATTPEALWNKATVSRYLGVSVKTLDRWIASGRGPRARKVGGQVRYRPIDVYAYVESCGDSGGVAALSEVL